MLQDLEWILELKELDFTLREIHMLLSLKRISGLADSQDIEELKAVYEGKQEFCLQEINRKQEIIQQLDKKDCSFKKKISLTKFLRQAFLFPPCLFCVVLCAAVLCP